MLKQILISQLTSVLIPYKNAKAFLAGPEYKEHPVCQKLSSQYDREITGIQGMIDQLDKCTNDADVEKLFQ